MIFCSSLQEDCVKMLQLVILLTSLEFASGFSHDITVTCTLFSTINVYASLFSSPVFEKKHKHFFLLLFPINLTIITHLLIQEIITL